VTLLAPIALAGLLVPLAIYIVHWLFGARRRVRVPALFLWTDLPQSRSGRARRRIPPFTWLLLLQIAAATLGVLALARPSLPADPPRHLALILDASATMQATDVAPTRFDAARRSAEDRLNTLRATDLVSLIRAGKDATLLASGSPDSVKGSLNNTKAGQTAPAIREALALASTRVAATPERHGEIVLVTDVAWPTPDPVGPLSAPVELISTGGGSSNQAITSVVVRMDPNGRGQTAFVEVANESDRPARVPVRLTADGAPLDERQVDIAPRTRTSLSIPLPLDAHRITVRLLGKDALALDDVVEAVATGGPPREVELVGRVSEGLRRAIESVPSLHVHPSDALLPPDLTVLDGVLPARLPIGPLLLIDPPSNSGRLLGVGLGSGARIQASHPLLQGLDLVALQDEMPSVGGVPGWAHVILGTYQGPLIMEGRLEGHPVVSLTFDPTLSGLEKSLAFPLLISNATAYLLSQPESPSVSAPAAEAFDPTESDIAPRPMPAFASTMTVQGVNAGSVEVWPWLAGAAVTLLGIEWLVFARRG
jgi:hypothetical protein